MGKEPTNKERLAAIEAILSEREKAVAKFEQRTTRQLDKLLRNSGHYVTVDAVGRAITQHAETCTKGSNPGNPSPQNPLMKILEMQWQVLVTFIGAAGGLGLVFGNIIRDLLNNRGG